MDDSPRDPGGRAAIRSIVGLVVCAAAGLAVWHVFLRGENERGQVDPAAEARIEAFCSDCHALPAAESFPRDRWHREVVRGYEFYARSGRNDLDPPPMQRTVAYFRSRAPERIVFPTPEDADRKLPVTFTVDKLMLDPGADVFPEIAHLRWARLEREGDPLLLLCDMRFGYVAAVDLHGANPQPQVLARLGNPCHVEPCDLDADLSIDLVVSDLGSFRPSDHDRGRVVWLRRAQPRGPFEAIDVASGLGRVADARPADFDGDGFPDFAALVSQEWEHVEAFVNLRDGRFHLQNLWAGPDLTFGSSGIELLDLDGDDDVDVLYTNGDAWDNWYVKPSHGVQWLENLGGLEFAYHRLTDLPGAYRALGGDLDLDGDCDVVAVAWLPPNSRPSTIAQKPVASIICLEQTEPGKFARHTLEVGAPYYAALELGDFDRDGDLDFAVGPGPLIANALERSHWLSVWRNQTIPSGN